MAIPVWLCPLMKLHLRVYDVNVSIIFFFGNTRTWLFNQKLLDKPSLVTTTFWIHFSRFAIYHNLMKKKLRFHGLEHNQSMYCLTRWSLTFFRRIFLHIFLNSLEFEFLKTEFSSLICWIGFQINHTEMYPPQQI